MNHARRSILLGGLACTCPPLAWGAGEPCAVLKKEILGVADGCSGSSVQMLAATSGAVDYRISMSGRTIPLIRGSGQVDLDSRLALVASDIAKTFNLPENAWPALFFFDDSESPNSFQLEDPKPGKPVLEGTRGSVVLGKVMIDRLLNSPKLTYLQGAALTGIIAHEFAHAWQRLSETFRRLSNKDTKNGGNTPFRLLELHADFMAGYYMGTQSMNAKRAVLDFSDALIELGDNALFTNVTGHGTSVERALCMYRGRNLAEIGISSITEVAKQGEEFVLGL